MKNNNTYKVFIVAGEESGDLHASKLVQHIKKYKQNIELYDQG